MSTAIIILEIVAVIAYLWALVASAMWSRKARGWGVTKSTLVPGLLLLLLISLANLTEWSFPLYAADADIYSDIFAVLIPVMWCFLVILFARDVSVRNLETSERMNRMLLSHVPHAVFAFDQDLSLLAVAGNVQGITGYTGEELVGMGSSVVRRLIYTEDADTGEQHPIVTRLLEGDSQAEVRIVRKDGELRLVEAFLTRAGNGDANGAAYIGIARDITQERAAERRYRTLVETMGDGLVTLDGDGLITYANEAFCRMLEYESHDLLGRPLANLCDEANRAVLQSHLAEPAKDVASEYELAYTTRSGRQVPVMIAATPLYDVAGEVVGSFGVIKDVTARRQAEAEAEAERARSARIIGTADALVIGLDLEGRITLFNRRCEEVTGYKEAEAIGRTLWDFVIPERFVEPVREVFEKLRAGDFPKRFENPWITRNGEERLIAWRNTSITDAQGAVTEVIGIGLDITEHRAAEMAVRESEERFRGLFEQSPIGMAVLASDGQLVAANQTLLRILGVEDAASLEGAALSAALQIPTQGTSQLPDGEVLAYEAELNFPVAQLASARDGTAHLAVTVVPLTPGHAGSATILEVEDITERKLSREALRESEQRLRDLVDSMADWVWETDAQGVYTAVSGNYEQILGYTAEELLGRTPFDLMAEDEARRMRTVFEECAREGKSIEDLESWNLHKDGHPVCLLTNATPVLDPAGNVIGYRGVDRDVTERIELRRQLEHAERLQALGTLARGVAHDFNNVLQALLGHITLFQMDKRPSDRDWNRLRAMSNQIEHGARLVSQLLAFSRGGEVERGPVNITEIIQSAVGVLRSSIQRTITLRTDLAEDIWTVEGDPERLEQVLMNLAINARDAMPNGGTLGFRTENVILDDEYVRAHVNVEPGPHVLISVWDTGTGMDEETLNRAFEPFFTTKAIGKGTGLGLAIVHGVLEAHGGHVDIRSELGQGTTFDIYLPAEPGLEPPPRQEGDERALAGGTETVLFVDDEPAILGFAADGLTAYGYKVITAENGRQALDAYREQRQHIDLVVLDLVMPEMDGWECLYHLLEIDPEVVVLVASGCDDADKPQSALESGARAYLEKPFALTDLLKQVRQALDN